MTLSQTPPGKVIAVAGASGFIGSRLRRALEEGGETARPLGRKELDGGPAALVRALEGCTALVDCIGRTNGSPAELEAANVSSTRRLVTAAEEAGLKRFVYLSSAAAVAAREAYGRSKRAAEEMVAASSLHGVILRPTMVYGPGDRRNLGFVARLLRWLPVVPVLGGGAFAVQPLWIDDLVTAIRGALAGEAPRSPYLVCGPAPVPLATLLRETAAAMKLRRLFLPFPLGPVRFGARIWQKVHPGSRLPLKQILALHAHRPFTADEARHDLGFAPRPFREGLQLMAREERW